MKINTRSSADGKFSLGDELLDWRNRPCVVERTYKNSSNYQVRYQDPSGNAWLPESALSAPVPEKPATSGTPEVPEDLILLPPHTS